MYTNENIDFVQPSSIGSTYARKAIPVGAILKFDSGTRGDSYLALGELPQEIEKRCPRVSLVMSPPLKARYDILKEERELNKGGVEVARLGSLTEPGFATFTLSFKNGHLPCTVTGAFNFGWLKEDIPAVRTLGTELGRFVSFKNDKIDPSDPNSEANLYLSLGCSPDMQDAKPSMSGTPVLLMKVTNKDRRSKFEFVVKSHQDLCVTRGIAVLKVM